MSESHCHVDALPRFTDRALGNNEILTCTVRYTTGIYRCANLNNGDKPEPSVVLAHNSLNSAYMLGMALLASAILLVSLKYITHNDADDKRGKSSPEFKRWWSIVRIPVFVIIIFTVLGTMYMFFAMRETVVIKFPNYCELRNLKGEYSAAPPLNSLLLLYCRLAERVRREQNQCVGSRH